MPGLPPPADVLRVTLAVTAEPESTDGQVCSSITHTFLVGHREAIIGEAELSLLQTRSPSPLWVSPEQTRGRLDSLYDHVLEALRERMPDTLLAYVRMIAEERFDAGYDLCDVQLAFNALEEAVWRRVFAELGPEEIAGPLGLISAIFGAAKDALACSYVALAARTSVRAVDVGALLAGKAAG
jgi:hypothetical protein